jgi:hypothetical protein
MNVLASATPRFPVCGYRADRAWFTFDVNLPADVVPLMQGRAAERVWLTVLGPGEVTDFDDVARAAGVEPLERRWHEVDEKTAIRFLSALLHRDLAYRVEVMPEHRAKWLAEQFIAEFGKFNSRFATNSLDQPDRTPFAWTSATDYTFDAGLVVMGEAGAGLYWIANED